MNISLEPNQLDEMVMFEQCFVIEGHSW